MSNERIDSDCVDDGLARELESWIEAARRGDLASLGRALHSFRDYLLLVASEEADRELQGKGGASDLVQETFFRAHRGFARFRGRSAAEWRSWLRSILVRQVSSQRRRFAVAAKRRSSREVALPTGVLPHDSAESETPSAQYLRAERQAAVMAAVAQLPEHYRDVVILHHRERLPFEEIGRRRGISAEAARKLWSRALRRLREELGAGYDVD
jgi:RNA polymerase sigma-70 factor (ECF subfamily)